MNKDFLIEMVDNYVYNDNVMINSTVDDVPANIFVVVEIGELSQWVHALSLDGTMICLDLKGVKMGEDVEKGFCLELERYMLEKDHVLHFLVGRGEYEFKMDRWAFTTLDPHLEKHYYPKGTMDQDQWENFYNGRHGDQEAFEDDMKKLQDGNVPLD